MKTICRIFETLLILLAGSEAMVVGLVKCAIAVVLMVTIEVFKVWE